MTDHLSTMVKYFSPGWRGHFRVTPPLSIGHEGSVNGFNKKENDVEDMIGLYTLFTHSFIQYIKETNTENGPGTLKLFWWIVVSRSWSLYFFYRFLCNLFITVCVVATKLTCISHWCLNHTSHTKMYPISHCLKVVQPNTCLRFSLLFKENQRHYNETYFPDNWLKQVIAHYLD